jgi:large subunit ribosomal protein L3
VALVKKGILGQKLGMTQVFDEVGRVIPVTVIEAGPCIVIRKKTVETDGYNAIQVGLANIKEKHVSKPLKGQFTKVNIKPLRFVRELRIDDVGGFEVGQELKANVFANGEYVDVTGTSRGKGFAGGIKRWNFKRGPMTHGSKYHRGPGSLQSRDASRVFKGRRLPGRLGGERVTVQGLKVVRVDTERNLILIKGAVPGAKGALVTIKNTVKAR